MRRRRGLTMTLAIGMFALIAATLGALTVTFVSQSARSLRFSEQTQLRQLLVAGAQTALTRLQSGNPVDGPAEIPQILKDQGLSVSIQRQADQNVVEIDAIGDHQHLSQRLIFENKNGNWRLVDAELGG